MKVATVKGQSPPRSLRAIHVPSADTCHVDWTPNGWRCAVWPAARTIPDGEPQ